MESKFKISTSVSSSVIFKLFNLMDSFFFNPLTFEFKWTLNHFNSLNLIIKGSHQPPNKMSNRTKWIYWCQQKEEVVLTKVNNDINYPSKNEVQNEFPEKMHECQKYNEWH